MSKVSVLARPAHQLLVAMLVIAFIALTTGCGGGSDAAAPPVSNNPPPPPPAAITGIATPTSVAVVTATNAQ